MMHRGKRFPSTIVRGGAWVTAALLMSACTAFPPRAPRTPLAASTPPPPVNVASIPDAIPRIEPLSRRGNPPFYDVFGTRYFTLQTSAGFTERGVASWYGPTFHGKDTSSGEPYDMYAMTAAHKSLPLPTYVQVTNLTNGRSIVVRVNDRGPFVDDRIIDLSYTAAAKLDMLGPGTAPVEIRAIDPRPPTPRVTPVVAKTSPGQERATYLQVGAFRNRAAAEQTHARLKKTIASAHINGGEAAAPTSWYRVRVGPLLTAADVSATIAKLAEMGFEAIAVRVD